MYTNCCLGHPSGTMVNRAIDVTWLGLMFGVRTCDWSCDLDLAINRVTIACWLDITYFVSGNRVILFKVFHLKFRSYSD